MSESLPSTRSGFWIRFQNDSAAWVRAADILAMLVAVFLPWSTSLVSIAIVLFVLALLPALDVSRFLQTVKRLESAIPIGFFLLAVVGTLWATDVPLAVRLHGINPVAKLLVIPLLIYHFETSSRGMWVLLGFLVSCVALMIVSWGLYATHTSLGSSLGVPVKDYIAQSQEFALCAFGAAGAAVLLLRDGRSKNAYMFFALATAFVANIAFVAISRTGFVCVAALFVALTLKYLKKWNILFAVVVIALIAVCLWSVSPSLRNRINLVVIEYQSYKSENAITSTGQRLEYWRKSIVFFESAPILGHGTGSIRTLFEQSAVGQTGVSSDIVSNPHNQTFNVAIQWGALGVILLYAMWIVHFTLFQGEGLAVWIGLISVVENIVSSLFNSHISDFLQGWLYVLAVGVAAGMARRHLVSRSDGVS